jgi:hypothetical protein
VTILVSAASGWSAALAPGGVRAATPEAAITPPPIEKSRRRLTPRLELLVIVNSERTGPGLRPDRRQA